MIIEGLNKKIQNLTQKLKSLKKHQKIGLLIMTIGVGLLIVSFIIVPLINTEIIWRSGICGVTLPEGCSYSVTLPENDLLQNKYDIRVINWFSYSIFGSIRFTHLATNTQFGFEYNFATGVVSTSFIMIPGEYNIYGDLDGIICEIWEHGLLPKDFDVWAYMGFGLVSIVIIYGGIKEFQGFEREYEVE